MKIASIAALAAVVALATGCTGSAGSTSESGAAASPTISANPQMSSSPLPQQPMSQADQAKLQRRVEKMVAQSGGELPSMVVGVWDPQKGVAKVAVGDAVISPQRAASAEDQFRIGSITKTFVATLVLQAVAEGRIDLNKTVTDYDPELAAEYPQIGTRTIRQLLSMRSGLPDFEATLTGSAAVDPTFRTKTWTADDLIGAAMESGKVTKPDANPAVYVNTNYIVLGEILEKVEGQSVGELVTQRLIEPLGLTRTVYPPADDTSLSDPHSDGYVAATGVEALTKNGGTLEPGTNVTDWTASWGGAAGIMNSTIDDLATWAATGFGSDLLPASLASQRASSIPLKGEGEYGLGIQRLGDWSGHTGGIPGWSTLAVRNDKTGGIVVMSNNSSGEVDALSQLALLAELYPNTLELF